MPQSIPKSLLREMKTNGGRSLYDITMEHPVLLVFLRYFGCSFCRQAMDDLSNAREIISKKGAQLICVHMDENERAEQFFKKYKLEGIEHISDPNQRYYKSFGLVRGSFQQLFGLKNMIHGFDTAILKGHGVSIPRPLGDGFQMPGLFFLSDGKIQSSYIHRMASDRPDYLGMVESGMSTDE